MDIKWYFPISGSPNDEMSDKFNDSKFNIKKWNSFAREILQNSIDAADSSKVGEPVRIEFSTKQFKTNDLPGAEGLKAVFERCLAGTHVNEHTRKKYENALKILNDGKVSCMKISDYNTLGVTSGLSDGWGALVYHDGVSIKRRPGSGGSHGLGKKAPFIISNLRTVFYVTKNEEQTLSEGRSSLISWSETVNGNRLDHTPQGWFGITDENNPDRMSRVLPVIGEFPDVNPFFKRNELGTDVIIYGCPDIDDSIKTNMINGVLENFFVAILSNKLECKVLGIDINAEKFDEVLKKYYVCSAKNFAKVDGYENLRDGNLHDYYAAYNQLPITLPICDKSGVRYGSVNIHYMNGNSKGKRYYSIFRDHGMKIQDVSLNDADQPFTCVAVVTNEGADPTLDDKHKLNAMLSDRENAAHDDFVIDDDDIPCDELHRDLINALYKTIRDFIIEHSKLGILEEIGLEGLEDIITFGGSVSKGKYVKKDPKIKKRPKVAKAKSRGAKGEDYEEGEGGGGGKGPKPGPNPDPNHHPAKRGDDFDVTLYHKYLQEPHAFHLRDEYIVTFVPKTDVKKGILVVNPVSVDGKVTTALENIVKEASMDGKILAVKGNEISGFDSLANVKTSIKLKLKDGIDYTLNCDVYGGK